MSLIKTLEKALIRPIDNSVIKVVPYVIGMGGLAQWTLTGTGDEWITQTIGGLIDKADSRLAFFEKITESPLVKAGLMIKYGPEAGTYLEIAGLTTKLLQRMGSDEKLIKSLTDDPELMIMLASLPGKLDCTHALNRDIIAKFDESKSHGVILLLPDKVNDYNGIHWYAIAATIIRKFPLSDYCERVLRQIPTGHRLSCMRDKIWATK